MGFNAICFEIRDILPEIGDMYRFVLKSVTCPLNFCVFLDFKLVHELFRVTWIIYELSRIAKKPD